MKLGLCAAPIQWRKKTKLKSNQVDLTSVKFQSQRGKAKTVLVENNLNKASFSFSFCIQLSSQTAHNSHVIYRKLLKFSCKGHLWWGAGEVPKKKNSRKGKFNLKKFSHAN